MNTLYITDGGSLMLDENASPLNTKSEREAISRIYLAKEDTKVLVNYNDKQESVDAKAGDIIIVFYERKFTHSVIVVDSKEWKENIEVYNEAIQREKEEWAAKNAKNTNEPCDCDQCNTMSIARQA